MRACDQPHPLSTPAEIWGRTGSLRCPGMPSPKFLSWKDCESAIKKFCIIHEKKISAKIFLIPRYLYDNHIERIDQNAFNNLTQLRYLWVTNTNFSFSIISNVSIYYGEGFFSHLFADLWTATDWQVYRTRSSIPLETSTACERPAI